MSAISGFPKIGGAPFLGVPIEIMVFEGLCWGPQFLMDTTMLSGPP